MKIPLKRSIAFYLFGLIAICVAAFVGVTYYYVRIFMNPAEVIVHGEPRSITGKRYRDELINQYRAQEVTITSKDGIKIAGLLFKQQHAKCNVVLCHGYRGMKETMKSLIPLFSHANILLFDFRGHGQSDESLITFGFRESLDVRAAATFLHQECDTKKRLPLIVLGISMGGAASIKAARDEPHLFDAVIVDSTYARLEAMIRRMIKKLTQIRSKHSAMRFNHEVYPVIPLFLRTPFVYFVGMLMNFQLGYPLLSFKPLDHVAQIQIPVFIIHSIEDEVIPLKNAYALYESAKNNHVDVSLWLAPACNHAYLNRRYPELYKEKVYEFLKNHHLLLLKENKE